LRPLYKSKGDTRATNARTGYHFPLKLQVEFSKRLFRVPWKGTFGRVNPEVWLRS
jgi:hypothetical protein